MKNFEIEVNCNSGGKPHKHTLVIEAGKGPTLGAGKPTKVRLQYTCPATGEPHMAVFTPPLGAPKPLTIAKVG